MQSTLLCIILHTRRKPLTKLLTTRHSNRIIIQGKAEIVLPIAVFFFSLSFSFTFFARLGRFCRSGISHCLWTLASNLFTKSLSCHPLLDNFLQNLYVNAEVEAALSTKCLPFSCFLRRNKRRSENLTFPTSVISGKGKKK